MTFKEKLVKLRKLKGITQDEFASAVGVSRQAVYKWESAQSYPEVTKLLELKLLFGISIDDLLDDAYDVAAPEKKKRKRVQKPKDELIVKAEESPITEEAVVTDDVAEAVVCENVVEKKVETLTAEATIEKETEKEPALTPMSQNVEESVEPKVNATPAPASTENEKKVGFFGRLFGRK